MVDRSKKQGHWTHEKNLAARRAAGPLKSLAMRTRRSFATLLALPHFVPERRVPPPASWWRHRAVRPPPI